MANRHDVQAKARGGGTFGGSHKEPKLGGGNKDVGKEAFSKKNTPGKATGGKVELKASGGAATPRLDKRARGGGTGSGWKGNVWSSAKKGK